MNFSPTTSIGTEYGPSRSVSLEQRGSGEYRIRAATWAVCNDQTINHAEAIGDSFHFPVERPTVFVPDSNGNPTGLSSADFWYLDALQTKYESRFLIERAKMRGYTQTVILFLTTLNSTVAGGIDELLTKASSVIEGTVVSADIFGSTITLQIAVSSVLLGSVGPGASIAVQCNGLKNLPNGRISAASSRIFFLRSTKVGGWACVPVSPLGNFNLGFIGYPHASPCAAGDLQSLAPKSARERILARVAESALCGAFHPWPIVLDASSPGLSPSAAPGLMRFDGDFDFDRRVFKALMKSSRRDVYMDGFLGLVTSGDPLPFDLITKNPREFQNDKREWTAILGKIEGALLDPSVIPHLTMLLPIKDAALQLAMATALQRFHTPAAVVHLGKILEAPAIEKSLALVAAKGLAEFANGCPMTTQASYRTPADYFPRCDEKAAFRTDETVRNATPDLEVSGDDDRHISFWKFWWLSNGYRVAALAAQ